MNTRPFGIGFASASSRENVRKWLENRVGPDSGFYPVDFHAVCGDIDIPWATKEGFECYQRYYKE
jgi:hypothetical protein